MLAALAAKGDDATTEAIEAGRALEQLLQFGAEPDLVYGMLEEMEVGLLKEHGDWLMNCWRGLPDGALSDALFWLQEQPETLHRTKAIKAVWQQWFRRDPEEARSFLWAEFTREERQPYLWVVAEGLRNSSDTGDEKSFLAPLSLADRIEVLAKQFGKWEGARSGSLNSDPYVMWELLKDGADEKGFGTAVIGLAGEWGYSDPEAAMAWLGEIPEEYRARAAKPIAIQWAEGDAYGLSQHLLDAPAGMVRDTATRGLVQQLSKREPDSAWQWAGRIEDPDLRSEARLRVIERWVKSDAEGAVSALGGEGLSTAEQEALRSSSMKAE